MADVATAFSPNGDGTNDIIRVKGYGIAKMQWRIYNRWGNVVFESSDQSKGWDGKFGGKQQDTGVFVYTLEVEFSNGDKFTKSGTITLLR